MLGSWERLVACCRPLPFRSRPLSLSSTEGHLTDVGLLLRDAKPESVVVMLGAGVSVSAGIPDFRTPGTGLYDNLQEYGLPYAEAIFDLDFYRTNPRPFQRLCRELWPGRYAPTKTHRFIKILDDKGLLKRCFTQNIGNIITQNIGNIKQAHTARWCYSNALPAHAHRFA